MYSPGGRKSHSEEVWDGHSVENHVGWWLHVRLAENNNDEEVEEEGHGDHDRHDVPEDGDSQLHGAVPVGVVDVVAWRLVETVQQRV